MKAVPITAQGPVETVALRSVDRPMPSPGPRQILLRVRACGVCHTDLHTVEGDIVPPALPVIPGHQIVGTVESVGEEAGGWRPGQRAGVGWLHTACGECPFCARGEENLCPDARFTGFHRDGGYAEYALADARAAMEVPPVFSDEQAAPLLCAGIIGYRSLRLADLAPGERLGLVGFGASAHLAIQIARHSGCEVYVFTRSEEHREMARSLGAVWTGGSAERPPVLLDRAVIFVPAGPLVPEILDKLRPGGTLAINAIHMSPLPSMPYRLLSGERTLRSVSNATRRDGKEFLELAAAIPIAVTVRSYPLDAARDALVDLKRSRLSGSAVLLPG